MFIIEFCIFIIGISIGSFLNVLIDRLAFDENPLVGRSYCDNCKKTLKWYDLIPVLSFILLVGKCRYCRKPVSLYYPLVEIITGLMFVFVYQFTSNLFLYSLLPYYLFIISALIVIFFADVKYGIIPDKIVFPAIVVVAVYHLLFTIYHFSVINGQLSIVNYGLSALGAFAFFLLLVLVTKGKGMGLGDVKFAFLMGLILGFPNIVVALYIAFLTGAGAGIILIVWKKKKLSGGKLPFGPFLVLGTFVSLFFGPQIVQMVLSSTIF